MDRWYRPDRLTGRLAARNTKKQFRFVLNKIFVEKKSTGRSERERIKERDVNFVIRFVREKMKDIGSDFSWDEYWLSIHAVM